jgi:hypothetical protein
LSNHLDLDRATLHRRAEREFLSGRGVPSLATMVSCALAQALGEAPSTDENVSAFIAGHPEPTMRTLCLALERARVASRPN